VRLNKGPQRSRKSHQEVRSRSLIEFVEFFVAHRGDGLVGIFVEAIQRDTLTEQLILHEPLNNNPKSAILHRLHKNADGRGTGFNSYVFSRSAIKASEFLKRQLPEALAVAIYNLSEFGQSLWERTHRKSV
jgi:hypothetical protein